MTGSADGPDALRFALLGPVRAWHGHVALDVGTPQQQAVLAMLVLRARHPVDLDELVDGVWGEDPPRTAVGTVRTYASRLRAGLGDVALRTVGRGYLLAVSDEAVDVSVFERDVRDAHTSRSAGDLDRAVRQLRSALSLCEGRPLFGVPGPYADAVRDRLVERRLQVLHDRVDVDLALGRHEELVGELTELCAEHPLREEFRAQLMLALYRSSRPADALAVYADTARALSAEFGVNPGPELAKLHERILLLDDTLSHANQTQPVRPAQLPADTADFTGRDSVVADLAAVLGDGTGSTASSVVVSAVAGIGGIGKTTVAVHVAHMSLARFPDGQLYVNLRGAQPDPTDPAAVLASFLRALGVADGAVPDGLEERAALYRSVLADRRLLVVLDDARDVTQVRPLLPGAPTCAVIVTSRSRLATLPATLRVDLDVMEPDEAVALLGRIVGRDRVGAEPGAALALVCSCGLLPLAVRIVGARLAARTSWTIAAMNDRLADQRVRLAELRADDLDVAACFRLGYDHLDAVTARVFRLLAVPDVPDIGLAAATAALDLPRDVTAGALERLVDLAMLESVGADRYRYHDLLRLFGRAQSRCVDGVDERADVLVRLLDFHLATARSAYLVVRPGHGIPAELAPTRSPGLPMATRDDALDWAAYEYPAVLAVIEQAMAEDWTPALVGLAADLLLALDPLLEFGFLWNDLIGPARAVLAHAQAIGDSLAEGRVGYMLGGALMQLGRLAEADEVTLRAGVAAQRAQDTPVRAETWTVRGLISLLREEFPLSIDQLREAVELAERCGSRWGEANALMAMATSQLGCGRVADALATSRAGTDLVTQLGDPFGEGYGLMVQGRVMRRLGDLDGAIAAFQQSFTKSRTHRLMIFEVASVVEIAACHLAAGRHTEALAWAEQGRAGAVRASWERTEAEALAVLGRTLAALGEPERSQSCLSQAHEIFVRLGLPGAEELRPLLSSTS